MKIVHTADFHLKKDAAARTAIFADFIKKISAMKTELVIIAGDLFDSDKDATLLRPAVKKIFESTTAQIIIIPGNHDLNSFGPDCDYGQNVMLASRVPFEVRAIGDLSVAAIPYQKANFSQCAKDLPSDIDIIIAHGTLLDRSLLYTLPDEEGVYLPILPSNIEGLCRYAALGHLHARSVKVCYKNTQVAYPGSPIALDTKCNTERTALVIDMDKKDLVINDLRLADIPYWETREFFVFPGVEEKVLDQIKNHLANLDAVKIMPDLKIKGFIGVGDRAFNNQLKAIEASLMTRFIDHRLDGTQIQSWDRAIEHRMVKRFVEKTAGLDDELRARMLEIVFPVFTEAIK